MCQELYLWSSFLITKPQGKAFDPLSCPGQLEKELHEEAAKVPQPIPGTQDRTPVSRNQTPKGRHLAGAFPAPKSNPLPSRSMDVLCVQHTITGPKC